MLSIRSRILSMSPLWAAPTNDQGKKTSFPASCLKRNGRIQSSQAWEESWLLQRRFLDMEVRVIMFFFLLVLLRAKDTAPGQLLTPTKYHDHIVGNHHGWSNDFYNSLLGVGSYLDQSKMQIAARVRMTWTDNEDTMTGRKEISSRNPL
mmetsp:Transcript_22523/g.46959  ORF Transcript_22523/g.46959 Transcript_22523/m.46959 type:complete len:149 (+) Transcript_22523:949-1395(+)